MERGWVWQLLSYAWIHSETLPIHIFFNLMMVWSLGAALEEELGGRRFLTLYGVGVLGAAVLWLSLDFAPEHVVGGASGAVFALLLGLAALDPQQPVKALVFFVIPWRARIGVMAWSTMTVELVLQLTGIWPEIAHAAHLGGGLAGWLLGRHYRKQLHLEYMKRHGYYGGVAAF
jgi:membrane associated rhomboid family serine protease